MGPLVPLALNLGGAWLARRIGGKAEGPIDMTGVAQSFADRERVRLNKASDFAADRLRGDIAASGVTGSGAIAPMADLRSQTSSTMADFEASVSDSLQRAKADYLSRKRDYDNMVAQNRGQGVLDIFNTFTNAHYMSKAQGEESDLENAWNWAKRKLGRSEPATNALGF